MPGTDVDIALLPIIRHKDGRWELAPRSFCTTSAELLYSPSYSLVEKHVWTYLFNHRCFDTFRRTGQLLTDSVRLADVAASASVSISTVSRAVATLESKRRLTRQRRGLGKPNAYVLTPFESGASVYPIGHPRSARKRIEALVHKAFDDRRSTEALLLQTALGFSLEGHSKESILPILWRRLERAAHAIALAQRPPQAVENSSPVTAPSQNKCSRPAVSLPPYEGIKHQYVESEHLVVVNNGD